MSGAPPKFKAGATDDSVLSGWVLMKKQVGNKFVWKRRFLDVCGGELNVFSTEPPTNVPLNPYKKIGVTLSMRDDEGKLKILENGKEVVRVAGKNTTIQAIAMRVMALKCGDEASLESLLASVKVLPEHGSQVAKALKTPEELRAEALVVRKTATTADEFQKALQLEKQAKEQEDKGVDNNESVLTFADQTLSLFTKKMKKTFKLTQVNVASSEEGHLRVISVTNGEGENIVLSVPDPLLLLQWGM